MKLWLIVPVKPLREGKSRLAEWLSPVRRATLSAQWLANVLRAARDAGVLAGSLVISRDPAVLAQARALGAHPVHEHGHDLNQALHQARQEAMKLGTDAVLVLPADLPLITAQDVAALYEQGTQGPGVVIVPSRDGGTNALLLRPPEAIPFAFGVNSFQRHSALARAAGLPLHVLHLPRLAHDIDWPGDLADLPSCQPLNERGKHAITFDTEVK